MTCFTFYCWCACHKGHDESLTTINDTCPECIGNHKVPIRLYNMEPFEENDRRSCTA